MNDETVETETSILDLKTEAEKLVVEFSTLTKRIADKGFQLQVNPDNTVYIFRNVVEEYGTRPAVPQTVSNPTRNAA